jgi:hypothetical protein
LLVSVVSFISCTKNNPIEDIPTPINPLDTIKNFNGVLFSKSGKIYFNFEHYFKDKPIIYGTQEYISDAKDTIFINNLSYRVSNIQLYNSLTKKWVDIGTYKLNTGLNNLKYNFEISNVPAGLYNSVRYNVGVDSIRNHQGEQTGDLDPALGMYWSWTNGYIHFRLEGRTKPNFKTFSFDIGGSQNVINKSFNLHTYSVKNDTSGTNFNFKLDINNFFSKPFLYDLKTEPVLNIHNENEPVIKTKLLPNLLEVFQLVEIKGK